MSADTAVHNLDKVTIKFAGDSGDGMQLSGTLFTDESALYGNDLATFPDYPAEIRAPSGTVAGVSGFQVQFGSVKVHTPGDDADALVAMNPAALKANLHRIRKGATVIVDIDSWTEGDLKKADYQKNPLETDAVKPYRIIQVPITSLTREALKDVELDTKMKGRSKNIFALGMVFWLYDRPLTNTKNYIQKKFAKKPVVIDANIRALKAGYDYAQTIEAMASNYKVLQAKIEPGTYRQVSGNEAVALGAIAASIKSGRQLFLGSYPITPASEIMHELAKYKDYGVRTVQAEDEIAGACMTLGASYAGALAITSTSGPGLDLKDETIGLAIITELPMVIVDVQRGGPSTGLPTKTEQSDLSQAIFGRHGEAPLPVIAASTPSNCFDYAYIACKIALEHMTPVFLLTDGFLGQGSEPWKLPDPDKLPKITPVAPKQKAGEYLPYRRDEKTLAREWAIPGMAGYEHRIGGLEKMDKTGMVSYDPPNHEFMCKVRAEKVARVISDVPDQTVMHTQKGELLVVGWGGTYGALLTATTEMQGHGHSIGFTHFNYMLPLPKNTFEIFDRFEKILICELNLGQFYTYLKTQYPHHEKMVKYSKVQGQPFMISELKWHIESILSGGVK